MVAALGDGTRTVVLCTGTGLVRVNVAPDGRVLAANDVRGDENDEGAHERAGPTDAAGFAHADARHCDMVATPRGDVERRWATIDRLALASATDITGHVPATHLRARARHDSPPRAPPSFV